MVNKAHSLQNLSEWLYRSRRRAGLNQAELAQKSGLSKSYISILERGGEHPLTGKSVRPSEDVMERLAKALGVPADEARLVAGYAPENVAAAMPQEEAGLGMTKLSTDEAIIVSAYRLVGDEEKEIIREQIANVLGSLSEAQRRRIAAEAAKREQREIEKSLESEAAGMLARAERETGKRVG